MFNLDIAHVRPSVPRFDALDGIFNAASCLRVVVVVFRGLRNAVENKVAKDTADERRKSKVRWRMNQVAKIPGSR
jgi:hypothetical protein